MTTDDIREAVCDATGLQWGHICAGPALRRFIIARASAVAIAANKLDMDMHEIADWMMTTPGVCEQGYRMAKAMAEIPSHQWRWRFLGVLVNSLDALAKKRREGIAA